MVTRIVGLAERLQFPRKEQMEVVGEFGEVSPELQWLIGLIGERGDEGRLSQEESFRVYAISPDLVALEEEISCEFVNSDGSPVLSLFPCLSGMCNVERVLLREFQKVGKEGLVE